jgi:hypothetical protein
VAIPRTAVPERTVVGQKRTAVAEKDICSNTKDSCG